MAIFKGIDVSIHNGNIDWNKVKKYGIDFAIIKCFYHAGNSMGEADNFKKNIIGAVNAGIKYIGVYSYSQADSVAMAKKEALQTLEIIKPYKKYITMPVYFDVEDKKNKGVEKAVSLAFCKVIEDGGYKAGIYSSAGWYRTYLKDVTEYTRWVAVYNGTFTPPSDIKNLDMWQYSSTGHVDGISGNVDMNYLYNKDILTINQTSLSNNTSTSPTVAKNETTEYYNEAELRQLMVNTFMKFKDNKMGSTGHHKIIDTYNTQNPLPRGYKMTYKDDWCAATCTAIGIMCGLQNIIFGECSCTKLIQLYTKAGRWIENEADKNAYKVGNFIIYDWNDGINYERYDDKDSPEHIGMIYEVHDTYVMVIEGNMGSPSHVGTRKVYINGRYIRGICAPDYASMVGKIKKVNNEKPSPIQKTQLTVDGSWGKLTTKRTQEYLGTSVDGIVSNQPYENKKYLTACDTGSWEFKNAGYYDGSDMVKRLETFLGSEGYYTGKVDGWCGKGVVTAMQYFLKAKKYYTKTVDGIMGKETVKAWQKYLNA